MRASVFLMIIAPIFACGPAQAAAEEIVGGKSNIIMGLLPTIVSVSVKKSDDAESTPVTAGAQVKPPSAGPNIKDYVGSGFVIDPSGVIVTNYHIVEKAFDVTVGFSDGSSLPGAVLSGSRLADVALIRVKANHRLAAAHWGNSDMLRVGDQVFAAGNPFGIGLSISAGIVSALNRDIENSPYDDYVQTDAAINHGNSGGPLFDMHGAVVGVNSAIISPTQASAGLGFALPSNSAKFIVDRLMKYGWVRPSWIGLKLQQVSPEMAEAMGISRAEGSIVSWVLLDGPAARAGLAIGDVVLRFNSQVPSDERALLRDIAASPVGDTIILGVRQSDGRQRELAITTKEWPYENRQARDSYAQAKPPKVVIPADLGLSLAPIPPGQHAGLGLTQGTTGVLVTGIAHDSDADSRGVTEGDVILRVGKQDVSSPDEVRLQIDAARKAGREFVLLLLLPKKREVPGPKWLPLRVAESG